MDASAGAAEGGIRMKRELICRCDSCGCNIYNDMVWYSVKLGLCGTELSLCEYCVDVHEPPKEDA